MEGAELRRSTSLGYSFTDERLLTRALTHRSAAARNNERLEFLGDAILNFLIAHELFATHKKAREGELTRLRATLVRRETLAQVARDLGLGELLKLGTGELKSGGRDRDSILCDALEALVGAVYLDSDIETCREWLLPLFGPRLAAASADAVKDPKTRLQEYLQARQLPLPEYEVTEVDGEAHEHSFTVECHVASMEARTLGSGTNRRRAEQDAAEKLLSLIEEG